MRNDYIVKRTYFSFVIVSILSALTATIGMLIDNIIVGYFLGSDALGAMGIVMPISLIFSAFGNICSGGGGARAAQAMGRGEKEEVNNIFSSTMIFVVVSGLVLTVLGLVFTSNISTFLGAEGALVGLTENYLKGYFWGAIPIIMMTAMMSFIRLDGSPKLPLLCIAVMSVINIILDIVMIFVFKQGMLGMALATTISYFCAVLVSFIHFTKKYSTLKLVRVKEMLSRIGLMIKTGIPTAASRIYDTLKTMILNNILVTVVGIGAVTALNVRTQANNFLGAVVIGIAQASMPLTSMFFGEEDKTALKDTLKSTLKFGLKLNFVIAIILLLFPAFFSNLLGVKSGDIFEMSNQAIRFFALTMPIALINNVFMNFYQCTRKTGIATLICTFQAFIYTVVFSVILVNRLGATGVWVAFLMGEILTLCTIVILVFVKNKKFPIKIEEYMMLEDNFGGNKSDRLEFSLNTMDEVMKISTGIYKFYEGRKIDKEELNILSLCIEEIAGNVVKHALQNEKSKYFDLTILDKEDKIIIRIRDNGREFNPVLYIKNSKQNFGKNESFGIRLIYQLAESFEYRRSIGINNTIITLKK